MRGLRLLQRRWLDLVTLAILAAASYQLASPLRAKWNARLADKRASATAQRNWAALARSTSPLSSPNASLQVVEISDYECPFCRKTSAAVDSAVGAGINVRYLNYPLPAHPHAEGAAIAALCADAEGHFHAMHERLMSSTEWQRDTNWVAEAKAVGIENIEAFQKCIHGDSVRIELAHERALADSLGISGTPMFVSQKSVHRGTATSRDLIELVGRE